MSPIEALALALVAFIAGAINAVAGGGSLISFPSIVAAGYSSKVANVTNTVALWPGYASSSAAYRPELTRQRRRVAALLTPTVAGAVAGSIVLLATPTDTFDLVVPFLILGACMLMATQDRLAKLNGPVRPLPGSDGGVTRWLMLGAFVLAVYGAYFGAGLGIMTLAVLGILLPDDLQHSNALKGMLSLIANTVGALWFGVFGPVEWDVAGVMAGGALMGGWLGVGLARRLGKRRLRRAVIAYGLAAAAVLLVRALR